MLKKLQRGLVAVLIVILGVGCQSVPQDKPPVQKKEPKKANHLGEAIQAPGKVVQAVVDGTGEVLVDSGLFFSFAVQKTVDVATIGKPATVNKQSHVEYARVGKEVLTTDILWPRTEGTFPVIVNFHGGAWHRKGQEPYAEHICRWLCNQGYVVFNVSYRLAPEYHFPVLVNDTMGAIIFAKTVAAKYNGDPTRVAVMGDSAGANLAAMCALCWDDPYFKPTCAGDGKVTAQTQANVLIFGVYDVEEMYKMPPGLYTVLENSSEDGKMYIGGKLEDMPEAYRRASPVHHLRKDMSPTLIVCGDKDPLFPQSLSFHRTLTELGIPNGLYVAEGETHAFTAFPLNKGAKDAYNAVNAFLHFVLKTPRPTK